MDLAHFEKMRARLRALEENLAQPGVFSDKERYKALSKEYAHLQAVVSQQDCIEALLADLCDIEEMLGEARGDAGLTEGLQEEQRILTSRIEKEKAKLESILVPPDPLDDVSFILELRAGTGGEEAAIFVRDCVRMYKLYADQKGWSYELLSSSDADMGGFKEYVLGISGKNAYKLLQYEGGTHRVQRVPATEAQGRVHTSTITVAVLPEPPEEEKIEIDPKDLRMETSRASGAGGQHVNVTDSAVRLIYIPLNLVVCCQDERSQHKNRAKALRVLQARIRDAQNSKAQSERASMRSAQVGSGDRSERVRTYNESQNRLTDHRASITIYSLSTVMDGGLDELLEPLGAYFRTQKISEELSRNSESSD